MRKTVIITNSSETFSANTLRMRTAEAREYQMRFDQSLGERGLLWAGDHKLVVTSQPIDPRFLEHIRTAMGYHQLDAIYPARPTLSLSKDAYTDPETFESIVRYCGSDPVNLIPYTTTADFLELAARLRARNVQVYLPESVDRQTLWLRDYLDSKVGFRMFAHAISTELKTLRVPAGFVCRTRQEATDVVHWFLDRKKSCIVKASLGAGGEGISRFSPKESGPTTVKDTLEANPYLDNDLLIVEEWITADRSIAGGSPSIDCHVPPPGEGDPRVVCLSAQILAESMEFIGVEVHRHVLPASLASAIRDDGLQIARAIAGLGYIGPFDIDLIVGQDGQIYMVEFNMRRTGGSHAHDAATYLYGPDYADRVAVITANKPVNLSKPLPYDTLYTALCDLLYPMGSNQSGIIFTNISLLHYGSFGYIIIAPAVERAHAIQEEMSKRLPGVRSRTTGYEGKSRGNRG